MPSISGMTMSVNSSWNGSSRSRRYAASPLFVVGDLEAGALQRLDQEPAHVVVVFGKQDLRHRRLTDPMAQEGLIP